jgi:hypothetical protein
MKIGYNNLYTHFVFTTLDRMPVILETFRERIEKYITGKSGDNHCQQFRKVYQRQPFMRRDISMATVVFGVFGIQT